MNSVDVVDKIIDTVESCTTSSELDTHWINRKEAKERICELLQSPTIRASVGEEEQEMPDSEFMKEWEGFLSERKSIRLRVDNDYWEEIRSLARIIDKHLTEMKENIKRCSMLETAEQRSQRKWD